jgi:hypothetical protein
MGFTYAFCLQLVIFILRFVRLGWHLLDRSISVDGFKETGVSIVNLFFSGRGLAVVPGVILLVGIMVDSDAQFLVTPIRVLIHFGVVRFIQIMLVTLN